MLNAGVTVRKMMTMKTITRILHCDGSTDRLTYQRNIALLALGKSIVDLATMALEPTTAPALVALGWINPFALVGPWLHGGIPFAICLSTFLFFSALVWNSVHRIRDIGWNKWLGLLTAMPFANALFTILLALVHTKRRSVWDLV